MLFERIKLSLEQRVNYLLIALLSLSFISCDTTESDEIKDQTEIYGHYSVDIEKGSKKVKGSIKQG